MFFRLFLLLLCFHCYEIHGFDFAFLYSSRFRTTRQSSHFATPPPNRIDLMKVENERRNIWKQIAYYEKKAVELILSQGNESLEEAIKFLAKSTQLKNQDPFISLALQYNNALEKRDSTEAEKILKAMKLIGLPPHLQSVIQKKTASDKASTTSESLKDEEDDEDAAARDEEITPEEVDPSSNFSDTVTENIRVKVTSFYDSGKSDPAAGKYMFWYKVAIYNEGNEPVQIVARMWEIEHYNGTKDVVRGTGVMNTQPIIPPGEMFTYQSTCPIKVFPPKGKRILASMSGAYTMCRGNSGQYNFSAKVGKLNFILPESKISSSTSSL